MTGRIDAGKEYAMLDGLTPDLAPRLVLAIGGVGVALVLLVLVLIFLKRRNSPLFIKGGKAREPRLMVLDAAAIDPKRRLVLIRRDEIEHLIMIGGPTDIVIETGISDRSKAAAPTRSVSVEEITSPQPVFVPMAETRQPQPAAERKPEPARPAAPMQPERTAPAPVETRPVAPPVQSVARAVAPPVNVPERTAPSADRYMERPAAERQPENRNVSAMGSVLYGEDREPMTGGKPVQSVSDAAVAQPAVKRPDPVEATPVQPRVQPVTSAAEAVLDAARDRVLQNQQASASAPAVTVDDAEKALAARMEAMRRVQPAQPAMTSVPVAAAQPQPVVRPAVQPVAQPAAQPVTQRIEPDVELPKLKDEPSDFEKLLEAELDANGVFGSQAPQVRTDSRVTNAVATNTVTPPVRVTPPITGATPDVTSEEEVARLLGEIAINRKP
jgi:hypothetical protein